MNDNELKNFDKRMTWIAIGYVLLLVCAIIVAWIGGDFK